MLNYKLIEEEYQFKKWYDFYYDNLSCMYNIFLNKLKKIKHKEINFNDFCIFIYNNSSKIILKE